MRAPQQAWALPELNFCGRTASDPEVHALYTPSAHYKCVQTRTRHCRHTCAEPDTCLPRARKRACKRILVTCSQCYWTTSMGGSRAPRWVCDIVSSRVGSADAKWGCNSRHCAGCCHLKMRASLLCVSNANLIPKFEALRRCAHDAAVETSRWIAMELQRQARELRDCACPEMNGNVLGLRGPTCSVS